MITKETLLYYCLSIISPTNANFYFENRDYLSNTLYMCFIGLKTLNFMRTKTSFLQRFFSQSRMSSKRKEIDTSSENESTECNNKIYKTESFHNFDCGLDLSNAQKDLKSYSCNMSSPQCSTLDCIKDEKKMKKRPNYFIAFQITDNQIHALVKQIQEHILLQNEHLKKSMISRNTLHITLMVMHLKDSNDHAKALKGLNEIHQEYNSIMCKEPLMLEFFGMGHFGNRVLFVKIKENASYKRLCDFVKSVHAHLEAVGISSTDTRKEFKPHLTIAKLDYTKKSLKGIRKISPSLYEEFIDIPFGSDTIKSIQLLRMTGPKTPSGYYFGDELFFSLNKSISWKKLSSLLFIAEKKKEIRNKIAKLSKKFLL